MNKVALEMAKLTKKQSVFVDEYLIDLNATQAAIRAGYSKKTAEWIGPQLLTKTHVAEAISRRMKDREQRTEITQDAVLKELARIGFGKSRNLMSWSGGGLQLKNSEEISDDDAAMVAEVSETTTLNGGSIKLKTHDKIRALELIGRHLGMFNTNKFEITGEDGGPIEFTDIERAKRLDAILELARKRRDGQTIEETDAGEP